MSIDVIVPWRAGCPHRERAWAWVRRKLEASGYRVVVAEASPGPWVKAAAIMPAIEASDAEIVVVHDADVWAPGLDEAIEAARTGWAMPHRGIFRLTEASTRRLLAGDEDWEAMELDQPPYLGMEGGGIVVARREVLLDVPMDPRFTGWGGEDECWGRALRALHGPPRREKVPLVHIWHPPQERVTRRWGSVESRSLVRRYQRARTEPEMRALIEEIHACTGPDADKPSGRDYQRECV